MPKINIRFVITSLNTEIYVLCNPPSFQADGKTGVLIVLGQTGSPHSLGDNQNSNFSNLKFPLLMSKSGNKIILFSDIKSFLSICHQGTFTYKYSSIKSWAPTTELILETLDILVSSTHQFEQKHRSTTVVVLNSHNMGLHINRRQYQQRNKYIITCINEWRSIINVKR